MKLISFNFNSNYLIENGYVSLYWYDADGNRTVKEHLGGEAVWVSGTPAGVNTDTLTYTIYPNPYITVNGNRWTKHYYVGGERIASRTGTLGGFGSMNTGDNYSAGHGIQTVSYDGMIAAEEDSVAAMYERFGVPYGVLHASARGNADILYFPITKENDNTAETASLNRNHPHIADGGQVYYFQRDHLGSTLTVTDSVGATVQRVEYTPWGEVFVELKPGSSGYETPYLFNGKELDDETGLYYYGARYYDPKLSVWYSTDRYAEKYPFASPYNYALNNPMKYVDLHGDTINWALNYSSYMTKFKVNKLREQSIVFNTLYKILDSSPTMYNLSADDKIVQEAFKGQSNWIYNNAKGYAYGNTVVFSEIYADINTFCEELFHLFQHSIYGNNRKTFELDAEAKLFNSVVMTEVDNKYPVLQGLNAIIYMINKESPSSFFYQSGQLIYTLMDIVDNNMQVLNNTKGANSYYRYLKFFESLHFQTTGDVYQGAQRLLLPDAYNFIIKSLK